MTDIATRPTADMTAEEIWDALYGDLSHSEVTRMSRESDACMFTADRWDWGRIIYQDPNYASLVWC